VRWWSARLFGLGFGVLGGGLCTLVLGDGRSAAEAVALIVFDQLVVGEAVLVKLGTLLLRLRLGTLLGRLLLGDPDTLLCRVGLLADLFGRLAVLTGRGVPALSELSLASTQAGAISHPRQRERQHHQRHDNNDYQHNDPCGHHYLLPFEERLARAAARRFASGKLPPLDEAAANRARSRPLVSLSSCSAV
jgi:hypothetical protein